MSNAFSLASSRIFTCLTDTLQARFRQASLASKSDCCLSSPQPYQCFLHNLTRFLDRLDCTTQHSTAEPSTASVQDLRILVSPPRTALRRTRLLLFLLMNIYLNLPLDASRRAPNTD